jgi:hypothetical protein
VKEGDVLFTVPAEVVRRGMESGLEFRQIGRGALDDNTLGWVIEFGWAPIWSVFAADIADRLLAFAPSPEGPTEGET